MMRVFFIAILIFIARTTDGDNKSGPLKCYQCNSKNAGQEDCGTGSISELAKYIKPCERLKEGTLKGQEATSCRKVHQNVNSNSSIVRECAYSGDEPVHGRHRTGNKGISLHIYQCFNEMDHETPCNGAYSLTMHVGRTLMISTFAFVAAYRFLI